MIYPVGQGVTIGQLSLFSMQDPSEQLYGLEDGQRIRGEHEEPYSTHSPDGHR